MLWQAVKNVWHLTGVAAAHAFYGFPAKSLRLIGVTGTDGKTTTVSLIAHILTQAGKRTSSISSVAAVINGKSYDTGAHTTTPYRFGLPRYLRMMHKERSEYGVLEITSHALDQHRTFGLRFVVSIITNITHEHLDYHKTYGQYLAAKAKIINQSQVVVLNRDDASYSLLASYAQKRAVPVVSFGIQDTPHVRAHDVKLSAKGATFTVRAGRENALVTANLAGIFNVSNILAAVAACQVLGIGLAESAQAIGSFTAVAGRMEVIDAGQTFNIIVDFAHTPNALSHVLALVKQFAKGRVILVFGCAGERDYTKRAIMGTIAKSHADIVVITAEDPRNESVEKISAEIAQGCLKAGGELGKTFYRIPDRKAAIEHAVFNLAKRDDTVLVTGKGHEKTMTFGTEDIPWSDQDTLRVAVARRLRKQRGSGQ